MGELMRKFEHLCYLIMCRQQANLKRRRLLSALNKAFDKSNVCRFHYVIREEECREERKAYRDFAEHMKKTSKEELSPLRKELKASIKYDGSNRCVGLHYDGEFFKSERVINIGHSYNFDKILLDDDQLVDPYEVNNG